MPSMPKRTESVAALGGADAEAPAPPAPEGARNRPPRAGDHPQPPKAARLTHSSNTPRESGAERFLTAKVPRVHASPKGQICQENPCDEAPPKRAERMNPSSFPALVNVSMGVAPTMAPFDERRLTDTRIEPFESSDEQASAMPLFPLWTRIDEPRCHLADARCDYGESLGVSTPTGRRRSQGPKPTLARRTTPDGMLKPGAGPAMRRNGLAVRNSILGGGLSQPPKSP